MVTNIFTYYFNKIGFDKQYSTPFHQFRALLLLFSVSSGIYSQFRSVPISSGQFRYVVSPKNNGARVVENTHFSTVFGAEAVFISQFSTCRKIKNF